MILSKGEGANTHVKIILDGLKFLESYWVLNGVNLDMTNCHSGFLVLDLKHLTHAIIRNCTFGVWIFKKVQNVFIKNCNNTIEESFATSLYFYNSSAYCGRIITIKHENITGEFNELWVDDYSLLHITQSHFLNNTANFGIIKALNSSSLIMSIL